MILNIVKPWTTSDSTWFVSAVPQLTEITVVVSVHIYYHLISNVNKCYGSNGIISSNELASNASYKRENGVN